MKHIFDPNLHVRLPEIFELLFKVFGAKTGIEAMGLYSHTNYRTKFGSRALQAAHLLRRFHPFDAQHSAAMPPLKWA